MFCKNCGKFTIESNCIYCGYNNTGKAIKKTKKIIEANNVEIGAEVNLTNAKSIENELPQETFVEYGRTYSEKTIKILNFIALSIGIAALLLNIIPFILSYANGGLNFGRGGMMSMYIKMTALMISFYSPIIVIKNLTSKKFKEDKTPKTQFIFSVVCLVASSIALVLGIVGFFIK